MVPEVTPPAQASVSVVPEVTPPRKAHRIVDRVVDGVVDRVVDSVVDRVVDRVVDKVVDGGVDRGQLGGGSKRTSWTGVSVVPEATPPPLGRLVWFLR